MKRFLIPLFLALPSMGFAQTQFGNSDPTPTMDCGIYQWPEVQLPCPEVQIKQKWDHVPIKEYRDAGWDTAITCNVRSITLSCMPYIPTQYFNGQYTVDVIPYNPPDTTFYLNGEGTKLDITADDYFTPTATTLGYPFFFFGYKKTQFRVGDNGIVTFTDNYDAQGNKCAWAPVPPLPWPGTSTSDYPFSYGVNCMRDAIYGVYQDTHVLPSTVSGNQGIYYGVVDEYPCRKIIASWNEIPLYSSQINKRNTYQMVCYEGSNIIEVHIKKRCITAQTGGGKGIIGIQNSTGAAQTKGAAGSPTYFVIPGSPAAFWPVGKNSYLAEESETAYRFTPQGSTNMSYSWYRIFDDGRDSIPLTTNAEDTNGYFTPMDASSNCPRLTTAVVPQVREREARYVFHLRFKNAIDSIYDLYDTITIGMDTANTTLLYAQGKDKEKKTLDICEGETARLMVEMQAIQKPVNITYRTTRISDGEVYELDTFAVLDLSKFETLNTVKWQNTLFVERIEDTTDNTLKLQRLYFNNSMPTTGKRENKIDSVMVQVSIEYLSGCYNYDTMMVRIFPNFDTTEVFNVCKADTLFRWTANKQTYDKSATDVAYLKSSPGCDSIVHLDLTVFERSFTVDHEEACEAYTWPLNGLVYETSNAATASTDTILLQNRFGCDSVVQLDLVITPLVPRIQANRQFFDFDNLDVTLNDVSSGSDSRTWILPGNVQSSSPTVYYTLPQGSDSAVVTLIAHSPYGCIDTTSLVIPMRKENFWMPNVFTPDSPDGNNAFFGSISQRTLTQEMQIFNRAGEMIFSCEGPDCKWDGRDKNGKPCVQGTYVWFIRYTNEFEPLRTHVLKGTVTLIR